MHLKAIRVTQSHLGCHRIFLEALRDTELHLELLESLRVIQGTT